MIRTLKMIAHIVCSLFKSDLPLIFSHICIFPHHPGGRYTMRFFIEVSPVGIILISFKNFKKIAQSKLKNLNAFYCYKTKKTRK